MQPIEHMVGPMMMAMLIVAAPACMVFIGLMIVSWRKRRGDDAS